MIQVVAAVIRSGNRILIARRPDHLHQGGLWEFPGGKIEPEEEREAALVRELQEELGIEVTQFRPLIRIPHHYHDKSVLLDVWEVTAWLGEPHGREDQEARWVDQEHLSQYEFPAANMPIIKACQLPDQYLVTPDLQGDEDIYLQQLSMSLNRGATLVQFRQTVLSAAQFESLARDAIAICHQAGTKVLLNIDPAEAIRIGADGVHLKAQKLMELTERPLSADYLVAASCHNESEILQACRLGLDFAVLGPVQATPTHPNAIPLGWQHFMELTELATIPVYALGGVTKDDLLQAWQQGGQGIAAIRALWIQ